MSGSSDIFLRIDTFFFFFFFFFLSFNKNFMKLIKCGHCAYQDSVFTVRCQLQDLWRGFSGFRYMSSFSSVYLLRLVHIEPYQHLFDAHVTEGKLPSQVHKHLMTGRVVLFVYHCDVPVWKEWQKEHEPPHDKTNKKTVRPAKTQISLCIHPVWSVFAVRSKGS